MPNDTYRGIGAILIAFALIGLVLWLAAARLSPETVLGLSGALTASALLVTLAFGAFLVRRKSR